MFVMMRRIKKGELTQPNDVMWCNTYLQAYARVKIVEIMWKAEKVCYSWAFDGKWCMNFDVSLKFNANINEQQHKQPPPPTTRLHRWLGNIRIEKHNILNARFLCRFWAGPLSAHLQPIRQIDQKHGSYFHLTLFNHETTLFAKVSIERNKESAGKKKLFIMSARLLLKEKQKYPINQCPPYEYWRILPPCYWVMIRRHDK